jgi:hypothetical protein
VDHSAERQGGAERALLAPVPIFQILPALAIASISLAYLEDDGILLPIVLLAGLVLLAIAGRRSRGPRLGGLITEGARSGAGASDVVIGARPLW